MILIYFKKRVIISYSTLFYHHIPVKSADYAQTERRIVISCRQLLFLLHINPSETSCQRRYLNVSGALCSQR